MGKTTFTLYQLLSFIAPGLFIIFLLDYYLEKIYAYNLWNFKDQSLSTSILFLALSLTLGLGFQVMSKRMKNCISKYCKPQIKNGLFQRLLIRFQDYTNRPLSVYENKTKLKPVLPFLKQRVKELLPKEMQCAELTISHLFTIIFNYLEVTGKDTAVKTYHSFYNCLYFTMTASFCAIIATIVDILFHVSTGDIDLRLIFILALLGFVRIILMPLMKWQRNSMMHKLFLSYYALIIHEKGYKNTDL